MNPSSMAEDFKSYALLSFLCLLSVYLLRPLLFKPRGRARLPPGPAALPVIGHLHLLSPDPLEALRKLSKRHGPLMSLRLGSVPCVVASSAETVREFLKTHEHAFSDRPEPRAVSYLTYGSGDFVFAPHGPYWKFMRKLCVSDLLGGRALEQLLPIRREERVSLLRVLHKKAAKKEAVDVRRELVKLTNNVISRMAMSWRCSGTDGAAEDMRRLVEETALITGQFNISDYIGCCKNLDLQGFGKRLQDLRRRFDVMVEGILAEKEAARRRKMAGGGDRESAKDVLDVLLDIYEDEGAEMRLTRENIKAFVFDIFAAGTETSAVTTEWALAELINHPTVLQTAREEIDAVVGKSRLVEESDIPNLPYLQAIVKETLRLHPTAAMIIRQSNKGCEVGGYHVPAKTRLFVNVWAFGRDPSYWPEPLEFRPERFVGSAIDVRGQHYHLLPFGSGRRGCPGTSLAMQVIQPALAAMIQCFEWEVNGGAPVDMAEGHGLSLPRAHPLVCTPVPRLDPMPLS